MSFSVRKITLFMGLFALFMLCGGDAFAAAARFPDLGVVGEHRLMSVVGFAQQDYYFDLFLYGGLQTLALTFALIGGLLILLIPKNHNIMTIGSYLFLIFVMIVGPRPSVGSLFFYPLDADPSAWDCPIPAANGLKMEVFCRRGLNSQSGNISDALPARTLDGSDPSGFGAFVPQLVTIHFFTAVERTLLNALWGSTENQTTPGDALGMSANSPLARSTISDNPNLQYYKSVYSSICSGHRDIAGVGDFTIAPEQKVVLAAGDSFTFADAIEANMIYYNQFADKPVYPARAATARIQKLDYAKSLTFSATDYPEKVDFATRVVDSLDLTDEANALYHYKILRHAVEDSVMNFPHSRNSNRYTNIFRTLIRNDNDYNYGVTGLWEHAREPDPYDYVLNRADARIDTQAGDEVDGHQDPSPSTSNGARALWPLPNPTNNRRPIPADQFIDSIAEYTTALETKGENYDLALAMKYYPVQLYFPYITKESRYLRIGRDIDATGGDPSDRGLLPRTYSSLEDLDGIGGTTVADDDFTVAVQSCLDLAAMIWSREFYALEEADVLPTGIDFRTPLTTAEAQQIVDTIDENDADRQQFDSSLAEAARMTLLREGCAKDAAGNWVGCASSTTPPEGAGWIAEQVCSLGGGACSVVHWGSGIAGKMSDAWRSAGSGDFASITASPHGAVGYGGLNSYSAAVGDVLVEVGLAIASIVQGFVYGAYMKLMPVIISYGIAITLFMTPFVFLMGLAIPMQARSVIIAPIVAIAFLKTVSIALVMVDHAFVSLMFWVENINLADESLYKSMLIMAHLTASVSLFSLAGLLLFGLNDPGSFVRHLSSMDKAGQVSFQEAVAYGAAPIAAVGMAKKAVQATGRVAGGTLEKTQALSNKAEEKIGKDSVLGKIAGAPGTVAGVAAGGLATVSAIPGVSSIMGTSVKEGYMNSVNARSGRQQFNAIQRHGGESRFRSGDDIDAQLLSRLEGSANEDFKDMANLGQAPSHMRKGIAQSSNMERGLDSFNAELQSGLKKSLLQAANGSVSRAGPEIAKAYDRMNRDIARRVADPKQDVSDHYYTSKNAQTGAHAHMVSVEAAKGLGMTDDYIQNQTIRQHKGRDMIVLDEVKGLKSEPSKEYKTVEYVDLGKIRDPDKE